jgi:hypothetical protein
MLRRIPAKNMEVPRALPVGLHATIAAAAATLVGLLFVAMSLDVDLFTGNENIGLRVLSRRTLSNLLFIIVFALVFVIPRERPIGLDLPLICNGIAGLINAVSNLRQPRYMVPSDKGSVKPQRRREIDNLPPVFPSLLKFPIY